MPPPGFKNLSLPAITVNQVYRAQRLLLERGIASIPSDLLPPELSDAKTISLGMVVTIALRCLDKAIEEKGRKARS